MLAQLSEFKNIRVDENAGVLIFEYAEHGIKELLSLDRGEAIALVAFFKKYEEYEVEEYEMKD